MVRVPTRAATTVTVCSALCGLAARACMQPEHAALLAQSLNELPEVLWLPLHRRNPLRPPATLLFLHIPWLGLPGCHVAVCPAVFDGMNGWSFG